MIRIITLFAALLATSACQQPTAPATENDAASSAGPPNAAAPAAAPAPSAPSSPAQPIPAPAADPTQPPPPHLDPDAPPLPPENSALGAVRRLQGYCDAVATRRYRAAYGYWSDDGRASGLSFDQFRDSFAKYGAYDCHIGTPGDVEAAAGSAYVEIPLRVTGVLTKGGGFRLEGPVTMRRVNDVDGSTAEQRRWHLMSSGLKPRP